MPKGRPEPAVDRFYQKYVVDDETGCWNWTDCLNNKGYGWVYWRGPDRMERTLAHRFSWEIHNGLIPDGLIIRHKCDNPKCVNPSHLESGTRLDNQRDMVERGRSCTGTKNGVAKLTDDDIRAIRASDEGLTACGRRFGITYQNVWMIQTGRTWRHVT